MSDPNADYQPPPPPPAPIAPIRPRPIKLRIPAIVIFGIGVLLVVVALIKIASISVGIGASFCFFGGLLFALSFIPLPEVPAGAESPMNTGQMLGSIFYEPSRVFRNLRFHPRWLVPFLIISVLTAVYTAAFVQRLTPERIVNHTMDKVVEAGFAPAEAIELNGRKKFKKRRARSTASPVGCNSLSASLPCYVWWLRSICWP